MAEWEHHLRESEKIELDQARAARDASATVLRNLTKRLKDACIKRMRRSAAKSENGPTE
jgi:hypothetical protein